MKKSPFLLTLVVLSFAASPSGLAIDHKILDDGRPLRLEDPYTKGHGEFTLETGIRFENHRFGRNQVVFPLEINYGLFPNFQLELGTEFFSQPRDLDGPHRSGDLHLAGLYNFNVETLTLPALGLKGGLNFPTGSGGQGTDFELKGLLTKSFGGISLHLNAAYEWFGGSAADDRNGAYRWVFGTSFPVGAPLYTRTTLLADVFVEQSHRRGERKIYGVEAGFRHQLTERMVLDGGLGTKISGPAERARLFTTVGFSWAF